MKIKFEKKKKRRYDFKRVEDLIKRLKDEFGKRKWIDVIRIENIFILVVFF